MIRNPVLRGFNPDPSFVRVGEDYYLATSTFEWWPGVTLHHSRDLVHWRLIGHALTRESQLRLRGVADSAGVWAPSLSYHDGQFWLIYTTVRTCGRGRPFKDVGICLATARDIRGPWSDPVTLNSIGFDPSLFHDDDGRKWLVNMMWDFRPGRNRFAGIVLQEYDARTRRLVGPMTKIYSADLLTEGPNLYKHNGWYYLMLAEGGTGWNHGIAMARSRLITGPYEPDTRAVLTTRDCPDWPLQKAGHGELVQTPAGEWYLAHLASRPIGSGENRRCVLGRETCLQAVHWTDDGWLRLKNGGTRPELSVAAPRAIALHAWPPESMREDFDSPQLSPAWQSLREPTAENWLSLTARPGWLRLYGRESLHSLFHQSLIAKRVTEHRWTAQTSLEFWPTHFTQAAGLICYYDTRTHFYLRITCNDNGDRRLGIVLSDDGAYAELDESAISIEDWSVCHLRAVVDGAALQFSASGDGQTWQLIGPVLDASKLSDDYGEPLHFTGAFVGLCAQDLGGNGASADFDYFEYRT